jgi:hypothetical protein
MSILLQHQRLPRLDIIYLGLKKIDNFPSKVELDFAQGRAQLGLHGEGDARLPIDRSKSIGSARRRLELKDSVITDDGAQA